MEYGDLGESGGFGRLRNAKASVAGRIEYAGSATARAARGAVSYCATRAADSSQHPIIDLSPGWEHAPGASSSGTASQCAERTSWQSGFAAVGVCARTGSGWYSPKPDAQAAAQTAGPIINQKGSASASARRLMVYRWGRRFDVTSNGVHAAARGTGKRSLRIGSSIITSGICNIRANRPRPRRQARPRTRCTSGFGV